MRQERVTRLLQLRYVSPGAAAVGVVKPYGSRVSPAHLVGVVGSAGLQAEHLLGFVAGHPADSLTVTVQQTAATAISANSSKSMASPS